MILKGKCNCGEKIICGCGTLSFDSYVSSSTSLLNVGNLIASGCTLDEYVIDWYVDDFKMLVTGKGTDPDIQVQHPMTGNSAVPVVGGLWTPVVRYITVAGQVVYTKPVKCRKWCEMIIDLPQITISSIYCGLIGTGANSPASYYDFKIKYTYNNDFALASRTIRFDLSASAVNFAYQFIGYTVADRIKIFHSNDLVNPLTDAIVGTTGIVHQAETMPYGVLSSSSGYKQVIPLPEYIAGDYLIIEIFPSVIGGGIATDWELNMKCLDASIVFEYDFLTQACWEWDINSFDLYYDSVACAYKASIALGCAPVASFSLNIVRYAGFAAVNFFDVSGTSILFSVASTANQATSSYQKTGYSSRIAPYGSYFLKKEGSVYTFTCADVRDYDDLKAGYDYLMASAFYTGWVNDPTNKAYYRYFRIYHYNSPLFCNQDGETTTILYFHITSQFIFDPNTFTVTITCAQITNEFPISSDPCNKVRTTVQSVVSNCDSTITRTDFNAATNCRWKYPLGAGQYLTPGVSLSITNDYIGVNYRFLNNKCLPQLMSDPKWYNSSGYYSFALGFFKLVITAQRNSSTGEWITDPLENFVLYYQMDTNTGIPLNQNLNSYKIYEKANNVVTTKLTWEDFLDGMS